MINKRELKWLYYQSTLRVETSHYISNNNYQTHLSRLHQDIYIYEELSSTCDQLMHVGYYNIRDITYRRDYKRIELEE